MSYQLKIINKIIIYMLSLISFSVFANEIDYVDTTTSGYDVMVVATIDTSYNLNIYNFQNDELETYSYGNCPRKKSKQHIKVLNTNPDIVLFGCLGENFIFNLDERRLVDSFNLGLYVEYGISNIDAPLGSNTIYIKLRNGNFVRISLTQDFEVDKIKILDEAIDNIFYSRADDGIYIICDNGFDYVYSKVDDVLLYSISQFLKKQKMIETYSIDEPYFKYTTGEYGYLTKDMIYRGWIKPKPEPIFFFNDKIIAKHIDSIYCFLDLESNEILSIESNILAGTYQLFHKTNEWGSTHMVSPFWNEDDVIFQFYGYGDPHTIYINGLDFITLETNVLPFSINMNSSELLVFRQGK